MRVLIVDNEDSFTFNLSQLVSKVCGFQPLVVSNTERDWNRLIAEQEIDAVVISPGPGGPEKRSDFGTCANLIREAEVPLLGVCLGHQGIGHAYGARVVRAPLPMHGRISRVTHDGSALFEGIPKVFQAVRYHSLCIERASIPLCLRVTATTDEGIPMAVSHGERSQFGVQFHPESVAAEFGDRLMGNFLRLASRRNGRFAGRPRAAPTPPPIMAPRRTGMRRRIAHRTLDRWIDPKLAFEILYAGSECAFWLDSSAVIGGYSRFSVMGDASGAADAVLLYRTADSTLTVTERGKSRTFRDRPLIPEIRSRLARPIRLDPDLPVDFQTGLVGFLGYEMRNEFGAPSRRTSSLPDAAFIDCSRCVVFDHASRKVLLVAQSDGRRLDPEAWFDDVSRTLRRRATFRPAPSRRCAPVVATLADGPARYAAKIHDCLEQLAAGESYQICLSSEYAVDCQVPPLDAYRELRRLNPAPYSAYFKVGNFAILSSSPERFLKVSPDRAVSAKPIKGTSGRDPHPEADAGLAEWLRSDEKSRSENLMIADLLRNDIGRVASAGSVRVPKLMDVETYATVHQLVSTVTGRLRRDRDCLDCLAAAFPGGSMTGAPKMRTVSIIDRLEGRARGPYSGALGFLSYGDRMDLSIVIRTIVMQPSRTTVASGGAIVALSDPREEFDEMILKAQAPLRALASAAAGDPDALRLRYATA